MPNKKRDQPKLFAIGLIAIVVLGIVAVLVTRGGDDDDADDGTAVARPVEVTSGSALPQHADGPDVALGADAPGLAGQSFDGAPVTIPGDGPTIVMFLAHWCPHCQAEVPVITDWIEQNGMPDGVELVAVSTAVDEARGNYPPAAWLEREGWPVTTMADAEDGTAANAYGLRSFPYFVAIGPDGTVVARVSGELTTDQLDQLVALARGQS